MREHKDTSYHESGRATAPPGVCYTSLAGTTSEDYSYNLATTPSSTNLVGQTRVATIQSPQYNPNYTNFVQQKNPSASPCSTSNYSPTPSPAYSTTLSKGSTSNLSVQAAQCTSNYSTSHLYSSGFSSHSNFSFCNSLNNNSNSHNSNNKSNNNSSSSSSNNSSNNICDNNSGDCSSTLKNSSRSQQPSFLAEEEVKFASTDQSSLFNYTKISKPNSGPTPKYTASQSNFANFSNNQLKYTTGQESIDLCFEKNSRSKKDYEVTQKHLKTFKEDETEIGCNFGEWQQFLSKHGTKIKHTSEANQDLVTDSFLHFLQKKTQEKNSQENYSYDFSDVSQILVSLTSKYKSEELSALKKKEGNEDSKLMNDFLTKILLEKEEKRFKSLDEKKKIVRKEIFDDFSNELDDKIKRDAMSQYQEEKTHHKRSTNFNDLNQWDYLNQQDIQNSNSNHNRREHFSFVGSSQAHSVGWNPMGMSMPRQSNPYYSNPHGHVLPAHAHSEFRYNQWNNPNQKNIPNIHNAHSQNTILPQSRLDTKHHPDISNSVTDFVLPGGPPSEFSKIRNSPRDIMLRTPPPDKCRSGLHSDHHASASPAIRNPTTRTPSLSTHSKTVISNPLSDLQMLVTNQESDDPTQKPDSYQQESVDLSAHSDTSKHKENSIKKEIQPVNENNSDRKEFRPPISVIQTKNKQVFSKKEEMCEKPVELTSKNSEKNTEGEISSSIRLNNLENNCQVNAKETGNKSEIVDKEVTNCTKNVEEPNKTSVIVEKDGKVSNTNEKIEEVIPKKAEANLENSKAKPVEMEVENTVQSEERTKPDELPEPEKEEKAALSVSEDVEKSETSNLIEGGTLTEVSPKIKSDIESSKRKASDEQSDNESKRTFLEVESQLEKMFGIGEENSDLPTVSSTSAEVRPSSSETSKKTPKKKPSRKSRAFRLSSGQSSSSESQFFNKKFRTSLNKEDNKKKVKKSICDSMDRRGPFLHIEGSKESPSCVTVINFPKGDDEDERDKSAVKKQSLNSIRPKHHNELDYRGKSKNGLFSSTLSSRYDAHTTDYSWVCVFCKKGPHYNTLGDLFGPYIISKDESSSLCDFSGDEKDITDAQKRGGRNKKSLRSNNMVEHFQKMSRKLRRTQSGDSCLIGMTVISDEQSDQLRYEVWVHEQCAIWSPNVCLIGSRIIGMQEAIWSSVKTMCSKCGAFGANIGCVFRNCPNRSHYHCAKENEWSLEQETFISTCHIHKPRS